MNGHFRCHAHGGCDRPAAQAVRVIYSGVIYDGQRTDISVTRYLCPDHTAVAQREFCASAREESQPDGACVSQVTRDLTEYLLSIGYRSRTLERR